MAELSPWNELEDYYTAQFCKGFGAPAKLFGITLGYLIIKVRLNLTNRLLIGTEFIREAWIGTSWIIELNATGTSESRASQATQLFLISLRTTPEAMLRLV